MAKNFEIRNSTAEFLTFIAEGKENGIQVLYKDETIWATQKAMATLFDVGVPAISKHLKNIFESGELDKNTTISKMETVVNRGFRGESKEEVEFYNLDAIISVGYRVNSVRATLSALTYKESIRSANRTAVSASSLGASLGFHATTNRTDADFTL